MNLTYINVTFMGKVLRWKMYLQDKDFDLYHVAGKEEHQFVPNALSRGHVGLKLCRRRFKMIRKQRIKAGLSPEDAIPDRMINEFLRPCPHCQITNRLRLPTYQGSSIYLCVL